MKLNMLFVDGMILQARKPIRFYGEGAGDAVIHFAGQTQSGHFDGDRWCVEFSPMEYGGPFEAIVSLNGVTTVIRDIYVGEVFLCAGQSNMEFTMQEERTPASEYASDDLLRLFTIPYPADNRAVIEPTGWMHCAPDVVDSWSALGYFIGLAARRNGAPAVGVVVCSKGASIIQSWIDEAIYEPSELALPRELCNCASHPKEWYWNDPGMLYHFMTEHALPYSYGNAVWYQGESNSSELEGNIYDKMLAMMIDNWRTVDRDPSLPFYIVQINDYTVRPDAGWKAVQAAQLRAAQWIPGVKTVICSDICEHEMIHPVTKGPLGERIFAAIKESGTI